MVTWHVYSLLLQSGSVGSLSISGRWIIHNPESVELLPPPNPFYQMTRVMFLMLGVNWMLRSYTTGNPSATLKTGRCCCVELHPPTTTLSATHITLISASHPPVLLWNNLPEGHLQSMVSLQLVLISLCLKTHHNHKRWFQIYFSSQI